MSPAGVPRLLSHYEQGKNFELPGRAEPRPAAPRAYRFQWINTGPEKFTRTIIANSK